MIADFSHPDVGLFALPVECRPTEHVESGVTATWVVTRSIWCSSFLSVVVAVRFFKSASRGLCLLHELFAWAAGVPNPDPQRTHRQSIRQSIHGMPPPPPPPSPQGVVWVAMFGASL